MKFALRTRLGRVTVAATALLMLMLPAPGSVLADTDVGTSGVVGPHSLVDTAAKAGATCRYKPVLLKRLEVRAPVMRAVSGTQAVAWRFSVLRTRDPGESGATTTKTYTSAWQTGWATTTRKARFSTMGVGVTVPRDGRTWDVFYEYVVNIEMVWMQADSQVTGSSIHRVDNYRWNNGSFASVQGPCGSIAIG